MNKLQAMAQIMSMLNHDNRLIPGSPVYKMVRRMVAEKIDRLGPEGAMAHVTQNKTQLLDQIRILCMWHRSTRKMPPPTFW
jgi:histone H3/H4